MEAFKILSSIGLVLDIIGVIMLFYFGLPSKIEENATCLITSDEPQDSIEKNNKYIRKMAYVSLAFLIVGFMM